MTSKDASGSKHVLHLHFILYKNLGRCEVERKFQLAQIIRFFPKDVFLCNDGYGRECEDGFV